MDERTKDELLETIRQKDIAIELLRDTLHTVIMEYESQLQTIAQNAITINKLITGK